MRVADLCIRRSEKIQLGDAALVYTDSVGGLKAADSSVLIRTYPYKSVPTSRAKQARAIRHSTVCRGVACTGDIVEQQQHLKQKNAQFFRIARFYNSD